MPETERGRNADEYIREMRDNDDIRQSAIMELEKIPDDPYNKERKETAARLEQSERR